VQLRSAFVNNDNALTRMLFAGARRIGQRSGVVALSAQLNTSSLQVRPCSFDATYMLQTCRLIPSACAC
jgi:hypothetical protein